jgi:Protein of unknown function (DUF2393)
MIVNAIMHQQVPLGDENSAKFHGGTHRWFILKAFSKPCVTGIKSRFMSEPQRPDDSTQADSTSNPRRSSNSEPEMFGSRPPERAPIPVAAWAIAGLVVLAVVVGLLIVGHRKPSAALNSIQPLAPYASNLPLSQLAMSESTSLSGGKSTFIDGHVQNTGDQTITGITVQVLFRNDESMPPQVETLPLSLIRTREPYIDTQPVSAAPLKPRDGQDFRLIFENIPANWNMQMPEVHIIQVTKK